MQGDWGEQFAGELCALYNVQCTFAWRIGGRICRQIIQKHSETSRKLCKNAWRITGIFTGIFTRADQELGRAELLWTVASEIRVKPRQIRAPANGYSNINYRLVLLRASNWKYLEVFGNCLQVSETFWKYFGKYLKLSESIGTKDNDKGYSPFDWFPFSRTSPSLRSSLSLRVQGRRPPS